PRPLLQPPPPSTLFPYTTLFRSHTAMTDNRIFEAVQDLVFFLENGINVVSSGPVLLQYPWGVLPEDEVERIHLAGVRGGASLHRSEEHTSELQSRFDLVCRLLLE